MTRYRNVLIAITVIMFLFYILGMFGFISWSGVIVR